MPKHEEAAGSPPVGVPDGWKMFYENPLHRETDVRGFRMEGDGAVTFPLGRMRLESVRDAEEGQAANIVFWCPEQFPSDYAITWEFWPVREPGLAIMFFSADGRDGRDLFDPALPARVGIYDQYHHGAMNAYHLSYFRRLWPQERMFHTCNLRKSYGFHMVAQGADPIPGVADSIGPYRLLLTKHGEEISFTINGLPILQWHDDGATYGERLGGGKLGFRQMAPFIGEYANLRVYVPS